MELQKKFQQTKDPVNPTLISNHVNFDFFFDPKYWTTEIRSQILTFWSQILTYFDMNFDPKQWCNPKYRLKSAIRCALCFQTLSSHGLQIFNFFGVKLSKAVFEIEAVPNTDLNWRNDVCYVSIQSQSNYYKHWINSALCFQNRYLELTQS